MYSSQQPQFFHSPVSAQKIYREESHLISTISVAILELRKFFPEPRQMQKEASWNLQFHLFFHHFGKKKKPSYRGRKNVANWNWNHHCHIFCSSLTELWTCPKKQPWFPAIIPRRHLKTQQLLDSSALKELQPSQDSQPALQEPTVQSCGLPGLCLSKKWTKSSANEKLQNFLSFAVTNDPLDKLAQNYSGNPIRLSSYTFSKLKHLFLSEKSIHQSLALL